VKARHRERWALGLTGLGLVALFEGLPMLDLQMASLFHGGAGDFPWAGQLWVQALYHGTPWLGRTLFLGTALVLVLTWLRPSRAVRSQWRRVAAVHLVMLLGVGLVVHLAFKERWGRPRPYEITAFAGAHAYVPALRPGGPCRGNCSFVSGHAATGFALVSLATFSTRSRRRKWFLWALCGGLLIGAGRVVQGGHFVSDVLFAGWFMWVVTALVREAWLRVALWRRSRDVRRRRILQESSVRRVQ